MSNTNERSIFSGMQILIGKDWVQDHAVIVEAGEIKAIIPAEMAKHHLPARRFHFDEDHYLCPGLIDMHIHGMKGHDVMDGSVESLHVISAALAAQGVTGYLATTMTADDKKIVQALQAVASAMPSEEGAAILGVHLEGPFLAASKCGAQQSASLQAPNIALFQQWQAACNNAIKLVTIAPELPGAIAMFEQLNKMDVITAVGHTAATYAETCAAIEAGCTHATHLFNAMRGLHQREPGAVGALLLSDQVMAELIVDGIHLHPAIVSLALSVKGKDRLLLVTDAMRATCLGEGIYDLGGQSVMVREGKAQLIDGTLAGSTLCLPQAIKNMVTFTDCSLAEAIYMASYNPAHALGLATRKGSINVSKDADLMVMDKSMTVKLTMRAGLEVYSLNQ